MRLAFGAYGLDEDDASLWCSGARLSLTPKCFALLHYLVTHPGRLVTKDELLDAVWPETHVADGVLKVRMRELRAALADDAVAPRFIETVHRRGYRFIAEVLAEQTGSFGAPAEPDPLAAPVGREAELAELRQRFEKARGGKRQTVFVSGEAGIGKTALVDAFTATLPSTMLLGRGQCLEHYGSGEAYLPVLEALGQITRGPRAAAVVGALRRLAPTWLAQLPWLLEAEDREVLQRELLGTTRERMLREMAETVEVLAADTPLVLVLEDLHWSDPSTVDLLSLIAHRRQPAPLLVVVTYRPVDVILSGHALKAVKQRLDQQRLCAEVRLPLFGREQVAQYLRQRLHVEEPMPGLADAILERTAGNPLFVVSLVDHMIDRQWLAAAGDSYSLTVAPSTIQAEVPEGVREMIEQQIETLPAAEARLLESASVAGEEFSAAAVAAALGSATPDVEALLREEARRGRFLRALGAAELAHGVLSERYAFAHSLHRDVLYRRIAASRRVDLHQRIGEWQEKIGASPAELASHFLEAASVGRADKAVAYAVRAADRARALLGYAEAARHYEMALGALALQAGSGDLERCRLLVALGQAQERSGALNRSMETFAKAADLARRLDAVELLAEAALGMGRGHHLVTRADDRLIALLEEALVRLGGQERPLRACVLARLDAALSPLAETHPRRQALGLEAVRMARRLGDPDTLLSVFQYARWGSSARASPVELRAAAAELLALADGARSKEQSLHFQLMRIGDLHELGEVEAAGVALDSFSRMADEAGIPWFRWFTLRLRAMRALQDGRLDGAERLAEEAFAFGQQMDHPNVRPLHAAQILHLHFLQGRWAEAAPRLTRYVEQNPGQHALRAELARLRLHEGDDGAARRELDTLAANAFADIPRDAMWLICLAHLAEVSAGLGDRERAKLLHTLLAAHADRVIGAGPGIASLGHASRYLGLLAMALERWEEAARLLDTARAEHERMGARPWLAYTLSDQARLSSGRPLRGRARAAASTQAEKLRRRALDLARAVGMDGLVRRISTLG
jgi:DNA-binding winged helix-turn-helix (wHTH) protein